LNFRSDLEPDRQDPPRRVRSHRPPARNARAVHFFDRAAPGSPQPGGAIAGIRGEKRGWWFFVSVNDTRRRSIGGTERMTGG